jgi:hypothetical protein
VLFGTPRPPSPTIHYSTDNLIVLFELWRSILKMNMLYCNNWPCDIEIKYSLN